MPIVRIDELRGLLVALYEKNGLGGRDARIVADIIIDAEACGRRTHGLIRVQPMLKKLAGDGHRHGVWLKETSGSALYDGRNGLGYLVSHTATVKALELLRGSPVAVVGVRGATHTGPIGYFARMVALEGYIAIFMANCSPMAAPWGATTAVLGTNPITVGLPHRPWPIIADLATTATTYGDCRVAIEEGRRLPEGVALDKLGRPTTDPAEALHGGCLLPFGGHKGYALAVIVQVLTSAFTGAAAIPPPTTDYGLTIFALHRDLLVEAGLYDSLTEQLVQAIKAARPEQEGGDVLLPGERSELSRERAVREGIEVPEKLYSSLFGSSV
ncbi:MAG: Ldh family oxidoreductase [Candidatus Glassbacteria bacterium]